MAGELRTERRGSGGVAARVPGARRRAWGGAWRPPPRREREPGAATSFAPRELLGECPRDLRAPAEPQARRRCDREARHGRVAGRESGARARALGAKARHGAKRSGSRGCRRTPSWPSPKWRTARANRARLAASARGSSPLATKCDDRQMTLYSLALLAQVEAEARRADRAGLLWGAIETEESRGPVGHWDNDARRGRFGRSHRVARVRARALVGAVARRSTKPSSTRSARTEVSLVIVAAMRR